MAITKILPIHTTIQHSVAYVCNPRKTEDSFWVYSENCSPQTAALEFNHYLSQTQTRAGGNTIGRHLIQSFAPGETTPEQAHEIGKRLAAEILKGEYAFVMGTHVDRGHIHNHFVWGAANIVTHKRYRSNVGTYHRIREVSDRLCKENELSVIVPQGYGKSYDSYRPEQTSGSWRDKLKAAIDSVIYQAKDFEDFLKLMESRGYKIKRGKHISFSAEGQERYTRAKSLGEGYTEEEIRKKILEKPERLPDEIPPPIPAPTVPTPPTAEKPATIKPLIDIAGNPKYAESRGLTQWARLQNLKNTAAAFNLMMEYGGMDAFLKLLTDCRADVATIENAIKANDERIKWHTDLRDTITDYRRTKPVYKEYTEKKTKFFKERFYEKHSGEIDGHERAASDLRYYAKPLPTLKEIEAQITKGKVANVTNRKSLAAKKAELNQLGLIHNYLYQLRLTHEPPPPPRERTQTRKRSHGPEL